MSSFEIIAKMEYMDLIYLLKSTGQDTETAETVADYLTSCIDYEFDLHYYIWNTLLFNVQIFDSKEETERYIEDELTCSKEDCKIYEAENGKWYLEY